ncbi:MAG: hypothetical protein WCQ64_15915 [Acidobacteriota bacterium]
MTNNNDLDTVAAFIDGERVDTDTLKRALATDEGRDYLVELVAMREIVAAPTVPAATAASAPTASMSWRGLAVAATVALAVGIGGYAAGHFTAERRIAAEREAANRAPMPTREIPPSAGTTWIETSGGQH